MTGTSGATFHLAARVSSDRPDAVRPVLEERFPGTVITRDGADLLLDAEVPGTDAKALNRELLSRLRRVEKRTRLRARWTSPDGTEQRYFDYVLTGTSRP